MYLYIIGPKGATGSSGATGRIGATGFTGSSGPKGYVGNRGPNAPGYSGIFLVIFLASTLLIYCHILVIGNSKHSSTNCPQLDL